MKLKNKQVGVAGAVVLPLGYVISLIILRDPDFIVLAFGPLGFPVWFVQWVTFIIGGWALAITATVLFLSLVGFLLGWFVGFIVSKVRNSK